MQAGADATARELANRERNGQPTGGDALAQAVSGARRRLEEGVRAQLEAVDELVRELEATKRKLQAAELEIAELNSKVHSNSSRTSPDELAKLLLAKFSCVGDLDPLIALLSAQDNIKTEEGVENAKPVLVIAQPTVAATFLHPRSLPPQEGSVGSAVELSVDDEASGDESVKGDVDSAEVPPKRRGRPRKRRRVSCGEVDELVTRGPRKSLRSRARKQN